MGGLTNLNPAISRYLLNPSFFHHFLNLKRISPVSCISLYASKQQMGHSPVGDATTFDHATVNLFPITECRAAKLEQAGNTLARVTAFGLFSHEVTTSKASLFISLSTYPEITAVHITRSIVILWLKCHLHIPTLEEV
ncbi:hypothetical protein QYF36_017197 [Acer negundo]|nr:hypothetical protein QYF36_017197 [Acer negundo]